jgi:hypothetical protein
MATGIILTLLGLWVILQITKGGLLDRLGVGGG